MKRKAQGHAINLTDEVTLAGWPTAKQDDGNKSIRSEAGALKEAQRKGANDMNTAAVLAGWPTPTVEDQRRRVKPPRPHDTGIPLTQMVALIGPMRRLPDGTILTGCSAGMESGGQLNPAHSRWLQGYPVEWCQAAIRAHRAMPKRQRKPE